MSTYRFSGMFLGVLMLGVSCVEEIDIDTDQDAQLQARNALVVEATLTDAVRTHEVRLSRAADFGNDSIVGFDDEDPSTYLVPDLDPESRPVLWESGASVSVEDNAGRRFPFAEGDPGRYFSVEPFGAEPGVSYQLQITLRDGERIVSEFEALPGTATLEGLSAVRATDALRGDGLQFNVDSQAGTGQAAYFRYTFEETFKVIAPLWSPQDFVLSNYDPCADPVEYDLEIVNRGVENQVCYRTQQSESVVQASTEGLGTNRLSNVPVHFIHRDQYSIAHRYSILVRQHLQDLDAFLYYDRLRNFSQEGNVFAQVQPGFLNGNLESEGDSGLLVIGYFSVASVDEQRIFLNFEDYFPGEPEPPFVVPCSLRSSPEAHPTRCPTVPSLGGGGCPLSVIELLDLGGLITYYGDYDESVIANCPGPHSYAPRVCGDCTVLGSNVAPDFWTE